MNYQFNTTLIFFWYLTWLVGTELNEQWLQIVGCRGKYKLFSSPDTPIEQSLPVRTRARVKAVKADVKSSSMELSPPTPVGCFGIHLLFCIFIMYVFCCSTFSFLLICITFFIFQEEKAMNLRTSWINYQITRWQGLCLEDLTFIFSWLKHVKVTSSSHLRKKSVILEVAFLSLLSLLTYLFFFFFFFSAVGQLAIILRKLKLKIKAQKNKKSSDILSTVTEKIEKQLKDAELQMQEDT